MNENIIKKELKKYQKEELNIIPRNLNWDIKKLLENKINKLNKRTQKAIVDILREKLTNMSESESDEEENEGENEGDGDEIENNKEKEIENNQT